MNARLFFALWPDESVRAELRRRLPEWTAGIEGPLQRPDQWHVTLEFVGDVAADRIDALQAVAAQVPMPPFEIRFDACEYWRQPRVACLVASHTPAALGEFVSRLRAARAAAGFGAAARPFRPHVTLARAVGSARSGPLSPPLRWPAARYALVRSTNDSSGSRYEPVHWWNASVQSV